MVFLLLWIAVANCRLHSFNSSGYIIVKQMSEGMGSWSTIFYELNSIGLQQNVVIVPPCIDTSVSRLASCQDPKAEPFEKYYDLSPRLGFAHWESYHSLVSTIHGDSFIKAESICLCISRDWCQCHTSNLSHPIRVHGRTNKEFNNTQRETMRGWALKAMRTPLGRSWQCLIVLGYFRLGDHRPSRPIFGLQNMAQWLHRAAAEFIHKPYIAIQWRSEEHRKNLQFCGKVLVQMIEAAQRRHPNVSIILVSDIRSNTSELWGRYRASCEAKKDRKCPKDMAAVVANLRSRGVRQYAEEAPASIRANAFAVAIIERILVSQADVFLQCPGASGSLCQRCYRQGNFHNLLSNDYHSAQRAPGSKWMHGTWFTLNSTSLDSTLNLTSRPT